MATADPHLLGKRLAGLIAATGPIALAQFMAEANAHYYASRDPLGADGDFITAPEVSQMFGELAGLWLTDLWSRAGSSANAHYVELGPGRGTLAEDALRAMRTIRFEPQIHLVETSPVLRTSQATRLPTARWHDDLDSLPENGPLLVIANEFFDALPIRQIQRTNNGWREIRVDCRAGEFVPVTAESPSDSQIADGLRDAPVGSMIETSPAVESVANALAQRIAAQGGAALIVDYGYEGIVTGDTLQAVSGHDYADVFAAPGERDLTAHVNFSQLAQIGRSAGLAVHGPIGQGDWLDSLGIGARTAALIKTAPHRQEELIAARDRLVRESEMRTLFKAMALVSPDWPAPAAF